MYPAARIVAPAVHAHFARHHESARARQIEPLAPVPEPGTIEAIIDAVFWASLRREEGYLPRISVAYLPPELDPDRLTFEQSLPLHPRALAKVAPIVERAGIHLGVWQQHGELRVWGTTRTIPTFCLVVEVVEPGLLVVKHHRGEKSGKYVNVAVLEGDRIKVVDEGASSLPDCPELLNSLLGFDSPASWIDSVNVLVQLAVSMRAHGRGGLLLVVPTGSDAWRESIAAPIPYLVSPPFPQLAMLMRESGAGRQAHFWQETLRETVDAVAGLTAVDGATVINEAYELLAFGAKIVRRRGFSPVDQVTVTEPVEGGAPAVLTPDELGGTRHLSAAQFVHDQRDAIALVASQDRRFTVFAWSPCENHVHAHRVDVLLL